jgi:K+-sensing histidine kinase KdpD
MGLAYCRRAVEAHGGSIEVSSKVGVGTTFTVRIPQPETGDGRGAEHLNAAANHPERESTGS